MLEQITPVILTYNEQANIRRVLDALSWAERVVVVDSFSEDRTMSILEEYPSVIIFQRFFDSHARQWNFAVHETNIATKWILALDADYVLSPDIIREISALQPKDEVVGYYASFRYCVFGKPLRGSLYPPVLVLYEREHSVYMQDGHTQRVKVNGKTNDLSAVIFHDDRKPFSSWLNAQKRYMKLEAAVLVRGDWNDLSIPDKLRKMVLPAPLAVCVYCLFIKLLLFDGWRGVFYTFQRTYAEAILSFNVLRIYLSWLN